MPQSTAMLSLTPHFTSSRIFHPSSSSSSSSSSSVRCLPKTNNNATTTDHRHHQEESSKVYPSSFPDKPWIRTEVVKVPTAPWMTSPLVLPASDVLDLSKRGSFREKNRKEEEREYDALTGRVKGGRSHQAMKKIVERVAELRNIDPPREGIADRVPLRELEFDLPSVEDGEVDGNRKRGDRVPWAMARRSEMVFRRTKKEKVVTLAEMTLSEEELLRLRSQARNIMVWIKAKKAGVTQDVVDEIRRSWKKSELVLVKFVEPLCKNMDRAREILEIKTGGLVVWKKKDTLAVYRGQDNLSSSKTTCVDGDFEKASMFEGFHGKPEHNAAISAIDVDGKTDEFVQLRNGDQEPQSLSMFIEEDADSINGTLYEREADRLLDELGPRFIDWWWPKPLPVDADLLPEVVPNFKLPVRRCPPYERPTLRDYELTYLRKLARPLPTHFALGKSTKLQGLASAIIKLWEKSLLAKIAIKRGVPNTNNELMSSELKRLTGGVLILRNKFYIILYRGKDFLTRTVAESVLEREGQIENLQSYEEQARQKAIESFHSHDGVRCTTTTIGTFVEFNDIRTNYNGLEKGNSEVNIEMVAEKERLEKEIKKQEQQLSVLKVKLEKSQMELAKLNAIWRPSARAADREMLTEEERQALWKIGLKMDEVLLLGRRGVYDGTIGSIHLHWKHRELVKVVSMQTTYSHVMHTSRILEIESGGILVGVEKLRTGHVIIIYRGRNYGPPVTIFPKNLPTKREALKRSTEVQRRGSLRFFARERETSIRELKCKLMEMEMQDLRRERDSAQFQLEELREKVTDKQPGWNPFDSPRRPVKCLTFSGADSNRKSLRSSTMRQSSTVPVMQVNEIRKLEHMQEQLGEKAERALEVLQKEVSRHRLGNQDAEETIAKLQSEIKEMLSLRSLSKDIDIKTVGNGSNSSCANLKEELNRLHNQGTTIANLEEQLENVQKSLDKLVLSLPHNNEVDEETPKTSKTRPKKKKKTLPLALSSTVNRPHLLRSPCSPHSSPQAILEDLAENKNPDINAYHGAVSGSENATPNKKRGWRNFI